MGVLTSSQIQKYKVNVEVVFSSNFISLYSIEGSTLGQVQIRVEIFFSQSNGIENWQLNAISTTFSKSYYTNLEFIVQFRVITTESNS